MCRLILLPFVILITGLGFGQTKYEKEIRIKKTDVPKDALSFIDSLNFDKKVKWYKEFGNNKYSIEAKTKYKAKKYSIEFTADGKLEDVEIEIKWSDLPHNTYTKIVEHLKSKYSKYSFDKVQVQYIGNRKTMLPYLRNGLPNEEITINYELVIDIKANKSYGKYEYLFSESGELLRHAKIILKGTDHIEY